MDRYEISSKKNYTNISSTIGESMIDKEQARLQKKIS